MSESVREACPDVQEWSGGSPGCQGVVLIPSRMSGVVGRPSRMFGSGREALQNVREWSGYPPRCLGVVGSPSQMFGSGRDAIQDVREWS